jgi:anti-sigma factor RsiW
MRCQRIFPRLSAFADHEVGPSEWLEIESHLVGCENCRRELESLRAIASLLGQSPERELAVTFTPRLMGRLTATPHVRHRLLPSLAYSLLFILAFSTGLWLTGGFNRPVTVDQPVVEISLDTVLQERQELALLAVQEMSLQDLGGDRHE